jgi:hypothetical protein
MSCALCKSNAPLQKSHIIPEFFFTQLYDQIHRFQVVPINPSESESFKQKGLREELLCSICEQKISRWEKYTKEVFGDGVGLHIEQNGRIFKLSNLDYRKFRLFLLSLLWRMGVSNLEFFSLADLGDKHCEILRLALLNEDPLDPLQYPCVTAAVCINGKFHRDWISQPLRARSYGHHSHCIVINGIFFAFYVTSHSLPSTIGQVAISKMNEMYMYYGEIGDIPILAEYATNLSRAIKLRKASD